MSIELHGFADEGWGAVADTFAANFETAGEVGANVTVYRHGTPVVDLWAGTADATTGEPWTESTVTNVFSCTKGLVATVVNQLIQEGRLDPDRPVADYWPEFAANGKGEIDVRLLLSHQAGLADIKGTFTLPEALSWFPIVEALAAQPTNWPPGTRHGYHLRSFGWLAGELIRRVTGQMPGEEVRRRLVEPLGISAWIGMREADQPRCARLIPPPPSGVSAADVFGPDSLQARVFTGPSDLFHYDEMWNRAEIRSAMIPSSGGIADARALARTYAACIGPVAGIRLLDDATVAAASEHLAIGPDAVLGVPTGFGLGYAVGPGLPPDCGGRAFGHPGAGGSLGFADPDARIGFGYVMNRMAMDPGDTRAADLVSAVYQSQG
jgi:CubicO group peptidase (beta-lactamase class C family)